MMQKNIYTSFVSFLLVFLYFLHGDNYLIIWKRIPSIVFFSSICLLVIPNLLNKSSLNKIKKNKLLIYLLIFTFFNLIWLIFSFIPIFNLTTNFSYLYTQVLNILIMLVCIIFFSNEKNIENTLKIMVYAVLLGVALNIYDTFNIGSYYLMHDPYKRNTFSMIYGRAAGFYLDPNVSAIGLTLGLILTEPLIKKYKRKLIYALVVGLAVALTLSLSGVLIYGVYFFSRFIYGKVKINTILIFLFSFVVLSYTVRVLIQKEIIQLGPGITKRIMTITNPFGAKGDIVKNNSRTILYKNSIRKIIEDPIFGKGIGQNLFVDTELHALSRSGTHAGPHNQWLAFMIDYGLLGILQFMLLFFILKPKLDSRHKKEIIYFLTAYFIYTMFSHTTLRNHSLMFLLPLIYQMGRFKLKKQNEQTKIYVNNVK